MYSLYKLQKGKKSKKAKEKIDLDTISDSDDEFEAMKRRIQVKMQQENEAQHFEIKDMIESDDDDDNNEEKEKELLQTVLPIIVNKSPDTYEGDDEDEDLFVSSDSYLKHRYHSSSDELPLDEIGKYESPLRHYRLNAAKFLPKIKIPTDDLIPISKFSPYQIPLQINDIIETDKDNDDNYIHIQQNEGINDEYDDENNESLCNMKQSETLMGYHDFGTGSQEEIYSDVDNANDGSIVGISVTLMGDTKNAESEYSGDIDKNDNLMVGTTLLGHTNIENMSDAESKGELMQNGSVTLLGLCGDNEKVLD